MGSFIIYRMQQAVPAKLEILHTCVQNLGSNSLHTVEPIYNL